MSNEARTLADAAKRAADAAAASHARHVDQAATQGIDQHSAGSANTQADPYQATTQPR